MVQQRYKMSNFDEKAGIVSHSTDFGKWYQTVAEVTLLVDLEPGTRGKEVQVTILPKKLKCVVKGHLILEVRFLSFFIKLYNLSLFLGQTIWYSHGR